MDLEKKYDKVYREELWKVVDEFRFDGHLIRGMSILYDGSRACERLGRRVGKYYEVRGSFR